jgi:hypothetical protein
LAASLAKAQELLGHSPFELAKFAIGSGSSGGDFLYDFWGLSHCDFVY